MNVQTIRSTFLPTGRPGEVPSRAEAEEAARGFESLFLRTIIKDMRASAAAFGDGMFGKETGAGIREGMFDTMLAERMAKSGRVGLADALLKRWEADGRIAKETHHEPQTTP